MPISPIVLQRRHAELGRIRLGQKGDRGQPQKLAAFRFTSPSERYIKDLAELYGGTAQPWDNAGVASFEVITEATSIPVIAIKGGLSQWMEFWAGGGCIHRCDGETNVLTGEPCDLNEKVTQRIKGKEVLVNPHAEAKPTTRLSVMLPELEAIGAWRMESKGWNAAAEIPAVAELAQFVGDMVPAHLNMVERRSIKDGKTSRFVVPVLDLHIGTARLREIVAEKAGLGELQAPPQDRPALAAGTGGQPPAEDPFGPYVARVKATTVLDDLAAVWDDAKDAGLVGVGAAETPQALAFVEAWKGRAHTLKRDEQQAAATAPGQPDADGIVDAEFTEDPPTPPGDENAIWQQILAAGAAKGIDTLPAVSDDFKAQMGGLLPDDATAAELSHYLGLLTGERAA